MGLFTFLLWVIFSIVVTLLGEKREIGAFWSFIISVFLSPLVGLIVVAFSKDTAEKQYQAEMLRLLRAIAQNTDSISTIIEPEKTSINNDDI